MRDLGYPYSSRLCRSEHILLQQKTHFLSHECQKITLFVVSAAAEGNPDYCVCWVGLLFHLSSLFDAAVCSSEEHVSWNETWFWALESLWSRDRVPYSISRQHLILSALHSYQNKWLTLSYQLYMAEGGTLPDLSTKYFWMTANLIFASKSEGKNCRAPWLRLRELELSHVT